MMTYLYHALVVILALLLDLVHRPRELVLEKGEPRPWC